MFLQRGAVSTAERTLAIVGARELVVKHLKVKKKKKCVQVSEQTSASRKEGKMEQQRCFKLSRENNGRVFI